MNYNTADIREFLMEFFNDEELSILSSDYFPLVRDEFTDSMAKGRKVDLLLEYCRRREIIPNLLAAIQDVQPEQYKRRFPEVAVRPGVPTERDPRQVFVSHAHQDADFAHRLANDLRQRGWRVWIAPDSIQPGEKWAEAISRGLEESGVFVLALTPSAVRSRRVELETNVALELEREHKSRFIPLDIEPCNVPLLWGYQRVSFQGQYENGLTALLEELEGKQPEPTKPPRDRWVNSRDGKEMVRIPAGEFLYGDDKEKIELPEFWIDKTPVTNAEYARFVAETGHEPPYHWKGKTPLEEIADHPVTWVSRHDAVAYAEWAGGRLPTEQEWEKAARGTDGREYPWGAWKEGRCNSKEAGVGDTTPVGRYSPDGDSPYGCVDIAGNVWEWTASEWKKGSHLRVCRGGSYHYTAWGVHCAYRHWDPPGPGHGSWGFRIVVVLPF